MSEDQEILEFVMQRSPTLSSSASDKPLKTPTYEEKFAWSRKALRITALTFSSIIPDLRCFTYLEAFALVVFAGAAIVFSFIDFNHFTQPDYYPSLYKEVNDRNAGMCVFWQTFLFLFDYLMVFFRY